MIVEVIVFAILSTVLCTVLNRDRPDFSFLLKIAGVSLILVLAFDFAKDRISEFYSYFSGLTEISDVLRVLIKAAVICIATSVTSAICKDNGNTAVAQCVELFGRFTMFAVCLPLMESIIKTALSFID